MTPERTAGLVARWVRRYTRGLPDAVARRRIDEIDADLHDHIAHERALGTADARIARSIAVRMVRGLAADASWRRRVLAHAGHDGRAMSTRSRSVRRSGARVALVTSLVLLVPLVGSLLSDEVTWSGFDFAFAAVLLVGTGIVLELAARAPRALPFAAAAAAIGVGAIVLGEADDAPGLVLFGGLVIAGSAALAVRSRRGRDPSVGASSGP